MRLSTKDPAGDASGDLEARARAGDPAAFGQLIRRHDDQLRGAVWAMIRDRQTVDDVMQSAYEKAFRSLASFDGRSQLKSWLHSICHHSAVDHLRYEARRAHEPLTETTVGPATRPATERVDDRLAAVDALGLLSPEQREILYLTSALGYTLDEVAIITGTKRGTVASRVSRAKETLREGLQP